MGEEGGERMKSRGSEKDEEIIRLFFARDEEAIRRTDLYYGRELLLFARRFVESREDAEECRNDTYYSAWINIPPMKPVRYPAWLLKVCRNAALDRIRRASRKKRSARLVELSDELLECIPGTDVEHEVEERELTALITAFLKSLNPEDRYIMMARCFYMDTPEEIASVLKCSSQRVRVILHRIRRRLKQYLSENSYPV